MSNGPERSLPDGVSSPLVKPEPKEITELFTALNSRCSDKNPYKFHSPLGVVTVERRLVHNDPKKLASLALKIERDGDMEDNYYLSIQGTVFGSARTNSRAARTMDIEEMIEVPKTAPFPLSKQDVSNLLLASKSSGTIARVDHVVR